MSDFHDEFSKAIRTGDASALEAFTHGPAATKFKVYRNNAVKGAADTLGDAYPAIKRLVGEKFFQGMAREFWAAHPPVERTLTLYGAGFADFIQQFEPAQSLVYLADVARLDRAWLEAHHAPDASPLRLTDIQHLPAEILAATAPGVHPSVRVLASDLPAFSIWRTNRYDTDVKKISLENGAETALIHRPGMEVQSRRLTPAEALFLDRISSRQSFETASNAVTDHFPGVEPAPVFIALLKEGVFNEIQEGTDK
jgi:hypothetical protein